MGISFRSQRQCLGVTSEYGFLHLLVVRSYDVHMMCILVIYKVIRKCSRVANRQRDAETPLVSQDDTVYQGTLH